MRINAIFSIVAHEISLHKNLRNAMTTKKIDMSRYLTENVSIYMQT